MEIEGNLEMHRNLKKKRADPLHVALNKQSSGTYPINQKPHRGTENHHQRWVGKSHSHGV